MQPRGEYAIDAKPHKSRALPRPITRRVYGFRVFPAGGVVRFFSRRCAPLGIDKAGAGGICAPGPATLTPARRRSPTAACAKAATSRSSAVVSAAAAVQP